MKIQLEPTEVVRQVDGQLCREWKGTDEHGVEVVVLVAAVSPQTHDETVRERYSAALKDIGFATAAAIDLRHVL